MPKRKDGRTGRYDPAYYAANKAAHFAYRLWSVYRLTVEEYQAMRDAQGGKCAICRRPEGKTRLCVDHDHSTNRVRGLLCHWCNLTVGRYEAQREAIDRYLRQCRVVS